MRHMVQRKRIVVKIYLIISLINFTIKVRVESNISVTIYLITIQMMFVRNSEVYSKLVIIIKTSIIIMFISTSIIP